MDVLLPVLPGRAQGRDADIPSLRSDGGQGTHPLDPEPVLPLPDEGEQSRERLAGSGAEAGQGRHDAGAVLVLAVFQQLKQGRQGGGPRRPGAPQCQQGGRTNLIVFLA